MTAILRVLIEGEPVPSQMGATSLDGKTARKKPQRVRDYQRHAGLLTMLAVNRAGWHATRDERFIVTMRFYMANPLSADGDNLQKCLLDGIKGIAFPDDRYVLDGHWSKRRDRDKPRAEVEIERLPKETDHG